jgi:hypothetical protein
MSNKFVDPTVREIHAPRDAMLEAVGGDIAELMQQVAECPCNFRLKRLIIAVGGDYATNKPMHSWPRRCPHKWKGRWRCLGITGLCPTSLYTRNDATSGETHVQSI